MISAVVLTHNNQQTINRTLASLGWCDEIVVIDDFSEDDTVVQIAESAKIRVVTHLLNNNFAAQRNYGLKQVKGDWVLFVDSDEVVSPQLAKEIQEKITYPNVAGFYLKRLDILFGKKLTNGETAHVTLLRLAKKDAGSWERLVHEVWNIQGATQTLSHSLEHYPHQTINEFLTDINTYSTVNAKHMFNTGQRVTMLGMVSYPLGKFIQNYLLRQGFRDGVPGTIMAFMMSFHSFLTRGKLYALQQKAASN